MLCALGHIVRLHLLHLLEFLLRHALHHEHEDARDSNHYDHRVLEIVQGVEGRFDLKILHAHGGLELEGVGKSHITAGLEAVKEGAGSKRTALCLTLSAYGSNQVLRPGNLNHDWLEMVLKVLHLKLVHATLLDISKVVLTTRNLTL